MLISALFAIASGSATAAITVRASVGAAARQSVVANNAAYPFALQGVDSSGTAALARSSGVQRVAESDGTVTGEGASIPVTVRRVADPGLPVGVLSSGRRPQTPREVAVTEEVAQGLAVELGDRATLTADGGAVSRTVVGVLRDPADRAAAVALVLDPALSPEDASLWLASGDPTAKAELRPLLQRRSILLRTTTTLAEERSREVVAASVAPLRHAGLIYAVCWPALLTAVLLLIARRARVHLDALIASGMTWLRSTRLLLWTSSVAAVLGTAVGVLCAWIGLRLMMAPVSALLGQAWLGVPLPPLSIVTLLGVPVLTVGVAVVVAGQAARNVRPVPRVRLARPPALLRLCALILMVSALLLGLSAAHVISGELARLWGSLVAASATVIIHEALSRHRGSALTAFQSGLTWGTAVASAVLAVVVVLLTSTVATSVHLAEYSESVSRLPQPRGSLILADVPSATGRQVVDRYEGMGGTGAEVFIFPDESRSRSRATSPTLTACYEKSPTRDVESLPEECWPQATTTPVGPILLARTGGPVRADSGLVTDARVGILIFDAETGEPTGTEAASAVPDVTLGGLLPSMVLSASSEDARRLGLRPSASVLVSLPHFDDLSAQDRAAVRFFITRAAPAALVAEESTGVQASARARNWAVGLAGMAVLFGATTIVGLIAISGHRASRSVLVDLATSISARRLVLMRWAGVFVLPALVAAAAGMLASFARGVEDAAGFGWVWPLPALGVLLGCCCLAPALRSVPALEDP